MKWLKRKLASWVATEVREKEAYGQAIASTLSRRNTVGSSSGKLNFSVYKARGGHIVEFSHYDQITDRHHESLHIITDQEDFSKELSNIVFMETLQR